MEGEENGLTDLTAQDKGSENCAGTCKAELQWMHLQSEGCCLQTLLCLR